MNEEEIKALDQPKRKRRDKKAWIKSFANMVYKMILDGHDPYIIYAYISKLGYPGTTHSLDTLIKSILMNNFGIKLGQNWNIEYKYPDTVVEITRNDLIKYITNKKEYEGKEKVKEYIDKIKEKYPVVKQLDEIYTVFHYSLMNGKEDELDVFIDEYGDSPLKTFVNGLKKDIHPTKNAISFKESSGFVEGNNNKFKLIKRILYGRSKLSNLFLKCYPTFLIGKENFELKKVLLSSRAYTHY